MSQYLYVKSCMCAIITLETPNLLMDAFDVNPVNPACTFDLSQTTEWKAAWDPGNGCCKEMAAVRKWLLTMNCQLLGCEPNI